MKGSRIRIALIVMTIVAAAFLTGGCDETDLTNKDVTYRLDDQVDLTAGADSLAIRRVDPEESDRYRADHDRLDKVDDASIRATVRNNSGCPAVLKIYLSHDLTASVPTGAVKVAELPVPGPAGKQFEIDPLASLTPIGEAALGDFIEDGDPFYVYLTASGVDCASLDITLYDARIRATLVFNII